MRSEENEDPGPLEGYGFVVYVSEGEKSPRLEEVRFLEIV
jgi:hypothetical protein